MTQSNSILWMGDIRPWMDDKFIMKAFVDHGFNPEEVKIINYKRNEKIHFFGLVKFSTFLEANDALFKLNKKKIPNSNSFFKLNMCKKNFENEKIVYVGNLSKSVDDLELYNYFKSKYPSVYYASVITDRNISRGYGFVHFTNNEEYNKCLNEMKGVKFHNKIIKVKTKTTTDNNHANKICNINESDNYIEPLYYDNKFDLEQSFDNSGPSLSPVRTIATSISKDEQKELFINNIKIIENNDEVLLKKKIQEGLNNVIEYCNNNKKKNDIPGILLYYT